PITFTCWCKARVPHATFWNSYGSSNSAPHLNSRNPAARDYGKRAITITRSGKPMPWRVLLATFGRILCAKNYAHSLPIFHFPVRKPSNGCDALHPSRRGQLPGKKRRQSKDWPLHKGGLPRHESSE